MIEVIDRAEAAKIASLTGCNWQQVAEIREGKRDDHPFVVLFAAHRQQAEDAMRERCAKVAEDWCISKAAQGVVDSMRSSISIAIAIRGIDAGGEGIDVTRPEA